MDKLPHLGRGAIQEGDHLAVHDVSVGIQGGDALAQVHLVQPLCAAMFRSDQTLCGETTTGFAR